MQPQAFELRRAWAECLSLRSVLDVLRAHSCWRGAYNCRRWRRTWVLRSIPVVRSVLQRLPQLDAWGRLPARIRGRACLA